MRFVLVNGRVPASNHSACCAVSQSGRHICGRQARASITAIMSATPATAKARF
jgi:hypothetical protein